MALDWEQEQREAVKQILQAHPPESGRCQDAAHAILPIAQGLDQQARILRISPRYRAPYVAPRIQIARPWYEHFTTEASQHYVDVLTGPDGTETTVYFAQHWQYPDGIKIEET